jgi:hypothetical protein
MGGFHVVANKYVIFLTNSIRPSVFYTEGKTGRKGKGAQKGLSLSPNYNLSF